MTEVPDAAAQAAALLAKLTPAEKIAFLHQQQPAVERLGLAAFRTGCEALHGVAWIGRATVFPQAVGLGATWDRALVRSVGEAVSTEVRAFRQDTANAFQSSAMTEKPPMISLNVWAPVVNLLRDPRWSRNEEGYSEDPYATAELATAYCRGLRGDHTPIWRTTPVLKHFLAYNVETERDVIDIEVPARVLHEYELPAFRGPIEAGVAAGVMPGYNLTNGIPNHVQANPNTTLVLVSSYPYAIGWAAEHVPSIIWTAHGGQELGNAVADVLTGTYNPAGRLPQTWYASDADLPAPDDYDIIGSGWTYQYSQREHLYPFGHGLSYTTFEYGDLALAVRVDEPGPVTVSAEVQITNVGPIPGQEVAQLYSHALDVSVPTPLRRLQGFERIELAPGESRTVAFKAPADRLAHWSEEIGGFRLDPGEYEFAVGRSSSDLPSSASVKLPGPATPSH